MGEVKKPVVYAFIDAQNLKMGVENNIYSEKNKTKILYEGWPLDYKKFRLYLTNKYGVSKAYLFIGEIPGRWWLYKKLRDRGFEVVLKPTIPYDDGTGDSSRSKTKGNVDADLVLYAGALTYKQYNQAVIVSGDGDFRLLFEYLDAENKLLKILAPNFRYSSLLNKFESKIDVIGTKKDELGREDNTKK
ncbi:MAG: NYN domain-containing protein [Candidatus Saccharimonadales bacterium]